jgi:hypothetical protein
VKSNGSSQSARVPRLGKENRLTFSLDGSAGDRQKVSETEDKFARAAVLMQRALLESTGLKGREQQLVVYWTLATHSLPHLDTFPLLALVGKMGTGKSKTLSIIDNFAFRPVPMSLRGMTGPAIRDKFAGCYEGTAIVEEADHAWKDGEMAFERILSEPSPASAGFPLLFSQPVRTFFASSDRGKHSNLRLAFFFCLPLAILLNLGPALGAGNPTLGTQLAMRCTYSGLVPHPESLGGCHSTTIPTFL